MKKEHLGAKAAVKGTMLQAHLAWAETRLPEIRKQVLTRLAPDCAGYVTKSLLATDWIPLRCLIAIDRAIAAALGGLTEDVFRELGRHSATMNLSGVYKSFIVEEPHRFFEQMALLHSRFQNFGRCVYERTGERAGRIKLEGYDEYSPVYCSSGHGYYEGALLMMRVPGPIHCVESQCQCAGDPCCLYDLRW
jgi:hypothetical protein